MVLGKMCTNLNVSLILLLGACLLEPVKAQTTDRATDNTVAFHEVKRWESAPQPPPSLRQVAAKLSGTLVGQSPNLSIEFILTLQNNWSQEVKILDPLDSLYLRFTTMGNKSVPVPDRVPKALIKTLRDKKDMPYPAPVVFRRIVRDSSASYEKEELITIPPGGKVQIVFESEPVVMKRIMQALPSETGEAVRSFKARAIVALVNAPPQAGVGGQLIDSNWIFFTIPSS